MTKLAIIVGGVVLMAGVALAGTLTSLGASNNPSGQTIAPVSSTTTSPQSDDRGRQNEAGEDQRGRENEAGEDLRGPCDEAEHANDPRCTGAAVPNVDDHSGPGGRDDSGHDGGEDRHGGGDD